MVNDSNPVLAALFWVLVAWVLFDMGVRYGRIRAGKAFMAVMEGLAERRLAEAGLAFSVAPDPDDEYDCGAYDYDDYGDDEDGCCEPDEADEPDEVAPAGFNLCEYCTDPCEIGVTLGYVTEADLAAYKAKQAAVDQVLAAPAGEKAKVDFQAAAEEFEKGIIPGQMTPEVQA